MNNTYCIIAVSGASGSGKTTFCKELIKQCDEEILYISQDSYYKDLTQLSPSERAVQNFDHPDSLDFDLLEQHIIKLKNGEIINQPIYDFSTHARLESTNEVHALKNILVEGTLILSQENIRSLCDLSIYVENDEASNLERRILRDIKERGRTRESVLKQYQATVKPMFDLFIAPSKLFADRIIPGFKNQGDIKELIDYLKKDK